MDCSPPSSSVHGILQEYWSGLPFSPLGDLPDPGIELVSPTSLALAGEFFATEPPSGGPKHSPQRWLPVLPTDESPGLWALTGQ